MFFAFPLIPHVPASDISLIPAFLEFVSLYYPNPAPPLLTPIDILLFLSFLLLLSPFCRGDLFFGGSPPKKRAFTALHSVKALFFISTPFHGRFDHFYFARIEYTFLGTFKIIAYLLRYVNTFLGIF